MRCSRRKCTAALGQIRECDEIADGNDLVSRAALGHYGQYDNYVDRNALLLKAAGVKNRTSAVHPSWCVASGVHRSEVWTKRKQIYKHAGLGL